MKNIIRKLYRKLLREQYASGNFLLRYYLKSIWKPKAGGLEAILEGEMKNLSDVFFIQVGANDGLINDPLLRLIHRDHWKGIMIEPQTKVFREELSPLYRSYPDIILLNAAISNHPGKQLLYTVSFSTQRWATGIAGFVRSSLDEKVRNGYIKKCALKYGDRLPANESEYIVGQDVSCITFQDILAKYEIPKVDLLQIDTEGFDFEIIKMFPFYILKPGVISFENENLSEADYKACKEFLTSQGYALKESGRDTIASLKTRN